MRCPPNRVQLIGPVDAPVTIVEFADFECPFCKTFATTTLQGLRAKYPTTVALVFRHWPLSYHRFAYPAARAAECAAVQGRFAPFYDVLYRHQESLGMRSFQSLAVEAGVPDTTTFSLCLSNSDSLPAIETDTRLALSLGAHGTPTIAVNGVLLGAGPDSAQFDELVAAKLQKMKRR